MRLQRTLRRFGLCAALLICASARNPALGQFSAPYDPDFAPTQESPKADPAQILDQAPATDSTPLQVFGLQKAGPFLLIEREDKDHLFEQPAAAPVTAQAEHDFIDFEMKLKGPEYTDLRDRTVRQKIAQGIEPGAAPPSEIIAGQEIAISTSQAPKPPPPEIELPTYGTSLSVTGRKLIAFSFSEKRFLNDQSKTGRTQSTNLIDIAQELQLRMQGKVGPKITVNVDYDDTKLNHQDISVVYTGDANEVVQNVSFGDIDLTLPSTEFVSYNKQLFGIRADIKYKGLKASFIGSRTKGITKSKSFFGNTQFVVVDLLDTAYLRRQYYDITFGNGGRLPIRAGSEEVFLSRQLPPTGNFNESQFVADDLVIQTSSFTGTFTKLFSGQDYTIDYTKGIITFRNPLQPQFVVAVDFIDASGQHITVQTSSHTLATTGGTGLRKIIKSPSDVPISTATEVGYNRELKTFYTLGQTQIVPDNGLGNFLLKIQDKNSQEVGAGLNPQQKYPDSINVDFANGIIQLQQPFAVFGDSSTIDPDIYAPTPITKRNIHVEYSFRFKTFFLEPNLVVQSEIVLLDSIKLSRNVDYFIDYEAGFITFFNESRIRANSEIAISFEVAPFVGSTNDSLLGTRISYDFSRNFSIGSTLLYEAGTKSPTVPTITELARSLLVYDFDAKLSNVKLLGKFKMTSFSGEFAQSRQNLNLNDAALIDNMEGIKQEESAGTLEQQWFIASNPSGVPSDPSRITKLTEDVGVLLINPKAQATASETQKVLNVTYDFNNVASEEQSIVFPFSIAGNDFSQKSILEVVMLGDYSGNDINFHLGGINEDADGNGIFGTEDVNLDSILQSGEDIGWPYIYAAAATRFGANNGRIDSEDLNGNGRLDASDFTGDDFGYIGNTGTNNHKLYNATDNSTHTVLDFGGNSPLHSGWKTFQIPLQISSATIGRWTNIKQLRISVKKNGVNLGPSTLKFARIAVVGNTWQRGVPTDPSTNSNPVGSESLVITPVNSVDNPTYSPIFNAGGEATQSFNDLYGSLANLQKQTNSKNLSEQALQLQYDNMVAGAVVTTKRPFSRPIDISQHKFFNFLLFGNADNASNPALGNTFGNKIFFLRAGNDTNFFEAQIPLTFTGWRLIHIQQSDSNGDSIMDSWKSTQGDVTIISSGTPSLQQVAALVAGVRSTAVGVAGQKNPDVISGRVFLNEIYVNQPVVRIGTAKKIEANFDLPGWMTFGMKYRETDRNFQTPTSVLSNQDNRSDSGYLNFSRISFLPMSFKLDRVITNTPSTALTGSLSNLVNLLQGGKVTTWAGSAQGNFSYGAYPRMTFAHSRNRIEYDLLTRLDDRKTYSTTLQYGVPGSRFYLPRTLDLSYGHTRNDVEFGSLLVRKLPGNFNTREYTHSFGSRLTFVPWKGSSFNPNYSVARVSEKRSDFTGAEERNLSYTKSLTQNTGFTSNFRILSWFNPQVNYSIDTLENHILNVSTFIVNGSTSVFNVGEIKTINRSANGSVSLALAAAEIYRRTKLFKTLNIVSGYQIQDGDVWNNVERALNSQKSLWVRTPLRPANPAALRQNLTLRDTYNSTQRWSPLEGYAISGRKGIFRTLSISNNYVRSIQRSDVTGTKTRTISTTFPDAVASISQLERIFFSERWMSNTQMNFKYSAHKTENVGQTINTDWAFGTDLRTIVRRRFDTLLSYNLRASKNRDLNVSANTQETAHQDATVQLTFDIKKFRFTPKTDYTHDVSQLGTGVKTQDLTVITPSLLMRADLALPRGLRLPGSSKTLLFSNRIIWTTTVSMAQRKSPVTIADNSRLLAFNTSGDYEIAKNLRMTLNGAFSRLWHRFLKEEDFISYQFGTTLTFQF